MQSGQGWSGYYDSADEAETGGMSGFDFLGAIQETDRPLLYIPDLAPVGGGAAYFPRSVDDDAVALNVLGFNAGLPGGGQSQRADQANEEGAWDSTFRGAVTAFQQRNPASGVADGWIGPNTRRSLAVAVAAFNLKAPSPSPLPVPIIPPGIPAPGGKTSPAPGVPVPAKPGAPSEIIPTIPGVSAETSKYLVYGAGGLLVLGLGYWLLK
jgi:hypothetical protein